MKAVECERVIGVLRKSNWFNSLGTEFQTQILDHLLVKTAGKGQILSAEDELPTGIFCICDGQVAITRRIGEDRTYFYYLGGPGFWCGEAAPLAGSTTNVSITARTRVQYILLPIAKLEVMLDESPLFYKSMAQFALKRFSLMTRMLAESHTMSPDEVLRNRLADFSDMLRDDGAAQNQVEIAISQFDIAQMIGCSRQTVNVLLKRMENLGLVSVAFRKIIINDVQGLRGSI